MRRLLVGLFVALAGSSSAHAACQIGKAVEFNITMQGVRPLTDVGINGRALPFVVDSGAFFSTISPGTAQELGLRLEQSPLQLRGIGGAAGTTYVTRVKTLDLAGIPIHNVQFIVGGSETGSAGLLGQNVLGIGDVEYDLAHGAIRLMRASGCSASNNLAYWSGQAPVSDLEIDPRSPTHPHTIGTVIVNGVKLRAIFDTGAGGSVLSLSAAKRVGITPASAGVVRAGMTRGLGRSMVATWIAPVASIKIGSEEVRNVKLHLADLGLEDADMLIGADFFLSHRVYVANTLRRMYFTYGGGPIFDVTPSKYVDEAGTPQTIAADNGTGPTDAAGFSRRGAAETSRGEYKAALADLNRAVAMDPSNGRYVLERARARMVSGDRLAAVGDLDLAVKLSPTDPEIRLAHAQSLLARKRTSDALTDLQVVDATLQRQADERLLLANLFERLDRFDRAISEFDDWIAAHPDDSRQPVALNARCWSRALAGTELPLALKDCDGALRRQKSGSFYDSRGLVELRLGQYDRAIADYDAALRLTPRSGWSLYGRGLARRHKGDPAAQSDLDAAAGIDPSLPERARQLGIN